MELIILNDGLYQLIPVTKQMTDHLSLLAEVDCFSLCEILKLKLAEHSKDLNLSVMKDGSGYFYGCMCR
jgi:hypothetical protein|tara:strand:+ start:481 stop:687 length:207 start_codon:yes stop_codon:yes gene_type:complete